MKYTLPKLSLVSLTDSTLLCLSADAETQDFVDVTYDGFDGWIQED